MSSDAPTQSENSHGSDDRQESGGQATDDSGGSSQDSASGDSSSDESKDQSENQSKDKNWLEWSVTIGGAAIVLFVLGFLIYQYGWGSDEPAELVVELGTPSVEGGTAEIPVTVRNTGDRVASTAVIEVCDAADACAELSFDYIPFASKKTGSVGLEAPITEPLETRVVSYRNP